MVSYKKGFTNDREILYEYAGLKETLTSLNYLEIALRIIKTFARICVTKHELTGEQHEWMILNSWNREDHIYFGKLVWDQCPFDKGEFKWKAKRSINLRAIYDFICHMKYFRDLNKTKIPKCSTNKEKLKYVPLSKLEHILLYINLIDNIQQKYAIERYNWIGIRNVVTWCDASKPEHFVVIKANNIGLNTVTLQHGVILPYFDYREIATYSQFDVPSRYFLSLGNGVDFIVKKCKNYAVDTEVIVCGQIKIKEQKYEPQENIIAIAGDIPEHSDDNQTMIDIAQKYAKEKGKHVYIRLHPRDNESNYRFDESVCSYNKDIDNAGVIVSYTSSMLFTYMALGKRVLRYKGGMPYYKLPSSIEFLNYNEFATKVNGIGAIDFKTLAKGQIDCVGEEAAVKYKKAFIYIEGNHNE